jgi:DDE superfamily endonuclease
MYGLNPKYFLNMDQTAVYFESKSSVVVAPKGKRSVPMRDSGSDAKRATIVVTICAAGDKLEPFFIFKGQPDKKVEQSLEVLGIKGRAQPKGWFDSGVAQKWIEQILEPYVADTDEAFLLCDHFSVHLTSDFLGSCNSLGVEVAGYTCVLQPVNVGFNAQLKKHVRNKHHEWCIDKYKGFPNASKIPTPERESFVEWVKYGFSKISSESLIKTFKYIGYWTGEQSTLSNNLNIDINPQLAIEMEEDKDKDNDLNGINFDNIVVDDGGDSIIARDIMLLPKPRVWAVVNEKEDLLA